MFDFFFSGDDDELYGAPVPIAWIGMEFTAGQRRKIEEQLRLGFGVDIYTDNSDMAICIDTAHCLEGVYWRTQETFAFHQRSEQRGRRFTG